MAALDATLWLKVNTRASFIDAVYREPDGERATTACRCCTYVQRWRRPPLLTLSFNSLGIIKPKDDDILASTIRNFCRGNTRHPTVYESNCLRAAWFSWCLMQSYDIVYNFIEGLKEATSGTQDEVTNTIKINLNYGQSRCQALCSEPWGCWNRQCFTELNLGEIILLTISTHMLQRFVNDRLASLLVILNSPALSKDV